MSIIISRCSWKGLWSYPPASNYQLITAALKINFPVPMYCITDYFQRYIRMFAKNKIHIFAHVLLNCATAIKSNISVTYHILYN